MVSPCFKPTFCAGELAIIESTLLGMSISIKRGVDFIMLNKSRFPGNEMLILFPLRYISALLAVESVR